MLKTIGSISIESSPYTFYSLQPEDAAQCYALSSHPEINFGETVENWQEAIESSKGLAFAIIEKEESNNSAVFPHVKKIKIIATGIGIPFNRKTRLCNGVVHPSYQRQGLGRQLCNYLINEAAKRSLSYLELDGSSAGKSLYESVGFKVETEALSFYRKAEAISRWKWIEIALLPSNSSLFLRSNKDLDEVIELDAQAFGSARTDHIKRIAAIATKRILVDRQGDKVVGFLIYQEERDGVRIGPWVHSNPVGAEKLLKMAITLISSRFPSTQISVHTISAVAMKVLETYNFSKASFTSYRMYKQSEADNDSLKPKDSPQSNPHIYYSMWSFGMG